MFEEWRRPGCEVAVIGLGRSGVAATRLLRRHEVAVYASDIGMGSELAASADLLRRAGATVELGGHDLGRIARARAGILSPGVPPDAAAARVAREAGVPLRAEIDLGLEAVDGTPYVAVTGTNGKSTTTALVAHLLRAASHDAEACGNIGLPLSAVAVQERPPAWLALEVSSFQLHDAPRIAPRAGILTNLSPDHLDRYPDLESYYADKRLFFRNANPASVWVTNADDAASEALAAGVAGRRLRFSLRGEADGWYDRGAGGVLRLAEASLLERAELPLLGDHNVANALAAALAVQAAASAPIAALAEGLRSFRPLAHRLEPVREVRGVLWINDSKATNLGSTEVALAAVDRPSVLLLGGRHKGESYRRLIPALARCRGVVAYGESRPLVVADLGGAVPVSEAAGFDEALQRAAALAVPGDAVLLSPACSSYDQFRNYEERGARFRALVEAM
jgi:UDP-N-acetylmuramoylalanine--D-glutamate ligase